ncbi:MAG: hypothetical protein WA144_05580 [Candidatus Methanoperedens sp.]
MGDEDLKDNSSVDYNYFFPPTPVDYRVIVTYGQLPVLKTKEQNQNWSNKLNELRKGLETELFFVNFFPNGNIITYGENSRGYLVVVLYNNLTIDRLEIYDIYLFIDEEARKIEIQGVPVEFGDGDFPVEKKSWASEMEKLKSSRSTYTKDIIATYGKLPELKTEEQVNKWFNIDNGKIINGLRENFTKKYFIPAGPLIGLGSDYPDGYIEVMVDRNQTVDKKLLDEMYGIIDKEARKEGFEKVPVRFVYGAIFLTDLVEAKNSSNNEKPSENETISQPAEELNKSTPGFGFLGGMILLLITGGLFKR